MDNRHTNGRGPEPTTQPLPIVRCDAVTHEYSRTTGRRLLPWGSGQTTEPVRALDEVSLTVDAGEVVGIAGPSGSGKSTLLHLLGGLLTPTAGAVTVDGTSIGGLSKRARNRFRFSTVGFVFQRFHLLPSLSARANVALPLIQAGVSRSSRRQRAMELLEAVGLADRATHLPGQLSGGEQQRVAIARALITDPAVILADEPTGELDATTSEQVLDVLTELASDEAVVLASHDETALAAADRVIHLHDGRTSKPEGRA